MGHPDFERSRKAAEKLGIGRQPNLRVSVFAVLCSAHFAAQSVRHELQPVADSEHGQSKLKHARIGRGSIFVINGRRPARENDSNRRVLANFFDGGIARKHNRKDILLADASGDQLGILGAEVEDDYRLGFHG